MPSLTSYNSSNFVCLGSLSGNTASNPLAIKLTGTPAAKFIPASKAARMTKKQKASATRRKRAAQTKAGRGGRGKQGAGAQGRKPIMVKTDKK